MQKPRISSERRAISRLHLNVRSRPRRSGLESLTLRHHFIISSLQVGAPVGVPICGFGGWVRALVPYTSCKCLAIIVRSS
jgi:hypothetical protein